MKQFLKENLIAPPPQKKQAFFEQHLFFCQTKKECFLTQIFYIRKRVWVMSFIIVLMLWAAMMYFHEMEHVIVVASAVLPFLSLVFVTEIFKSMQYQMQELEASCKHNLKYLTLVRICVIGVVDSIIFTTLIFLIYQQSSFGLLRNMIYLMVPFLCCSLCSLWIVNHQNQQNAVFLCGVVSTLIGGTVLLQANTFLYWYQQKYFGGWCIAFMVCLLILIREIYIFINGRTQQWNFV